MTLTVFKEAVIEQMLAFLWRQWSALGVLGEAGLSDDDWVIDPEALLVFSLKAARYDARLFDEILGWVLTNGEWLDISRLKNMLSRLDGVELRVMGGAIQWLQTHGDKRKWQSMAQHSIKLYEKDPILKFEESLFKDKAGTPHPEVSKEKADPDFLFFNINRPKVTMETRKETREVPVNVRTNLRFLLRSLFGISGKSECLAYLLTHEGCRPRDIAFEVGLFWLGIQNTLSDLAKSGLVLTRSRGEKKIEYWLSHKKWWEFLASSFPEPAPKWVNWRQIFSALSQLIEVMEEFSGDEGLKDGDYMQYSKLQDSFQWITDEFSRGGYDVAPLSIMGLSQDLSEKTVLKFLAGIFGLSFLYTEDGKGGTEKVRT